MSDIPALRVSIDQVDADIAALVVRRRGFSAEIQRLRLAGGGGPVDPAREEAVVEAYAAVLGAAGPALAHAVLDACRPRPEG